IFRDDGSSLGTYAAVDAVRLDTPVVSERILKCFEHERERVEILDSQLGLVEPCVFEVRVFLGGAIDQRHAQLMITGLSGVDFDPRGESVAPSHAGQGARDLLFSISMYPYPYRHFDRESNADGPGLLPYLRRLVPQPNPKTRDDTEAPRSRPSGFNLDPECTGFQPFPPITPVAFGHGLGGLHSPQPILP